MGYQKVLRQKAEEILKKELAGSTREAKGIPSGWALGDLSEVELLKLFHELQVQQLELEIQNLEHVRVKEQAEAEAAKYLELYDSSPSGYLTLSKEGKIVELNLAGAQMLRSERAKLKNTKFGFFVSPDNRSIFDLFIVKVFAGIAKESCELILSINKELPIDVYLTGLVKPDGEHCFITMVDISARKRMERDLISANKEILLQSEESEKRGFDLLVSNRLIAFQRDRLQKITSLVPGVMFQYRLRRDGSSCFPYASDVIQTMYRITAEDIANDASIFFAKLHPEDLEGFISSMKESAKDLSLWQHEFRVLYEDGSVQYHAGKGLPQPGEDGSVLWHGIITDITEHRYSEDSLLQTEQKKVLFREIRRKILSIFNEQGNLLDCIQNVINTLKDQTGFDAIGIRLQDGDDFPYFAQNGFLPEFLSTENTLIARSRDGGLCRDEDGNINLECTCGFVISGKKEPLNSLFTPGGSIWTNDSLPFLSLAPEMDPRFHPRNQCIHQGYASVALIPIKNKDKNIGLIQFNDKRKDCFTVDMIESLEGIAMQIGEAILRKQAEEELQKSNELLSLFMNHSPIFAFIKEVSQTESRTLKASENYRDMIGISGSEMAGKTMYELFPAELAASITADDWKVASEEKQIEIEETFNGRIYYSIKFPITLGGKKLLAGYSIDITERRMLENELQEREQQYRILVETSPDGIMIVQGASFMFVNQPLAEITGYSIEELMMMPIMEMVYHEDRDLVENNYRKRQKGEGADPKYHFRIVKKDGSLAWIELNGKKTEWKGETAVLQFVSDITERKHAEVEIQRKNAELHELNAEKDKFFSIISHDLRSPFQALLGYFPLTLEKIKTYPLEKVQLLLFDMRTSAEKLFNLLENLLEWSKMQRGLISFHPSAIRLQEVITEIVTIIRNSADKKMIEISYDIPAHLTVSADKRMFDSILNNLVFNAVKFTHINGKVTISAKPIPDDFVEITIRDTGIGMNKEMIDSLFRLDADVSHKGTEGEPSSGIGLFICKDFVEKHGGRLWVESEEGQGSTFRFTLPNLSSLNKSQ